MAGDLPARRLRYDGRDGLVGAGVVRERAAVGEDTAEVGRPGRGAGGGPELVGAQPVLVPDARAEAVSSAV
ncbi:hypothetical protein [Nocardioides humi]|uniref:hypothetical protein n=1 Tax=Nocardioides humi TaxID=449461 RepID=UPI001C63CE75|nr:hypothetical protein [Nocardioides humi]